MKQVFRTTFFVFILFSCISFFSSVEELYAQTLITELPNVNPILPVGEDNGTYDVESQKNDTIEINNQKEDQAFLGGLLAGILGGLAVGFSFGWLFKDALFSKR